MKTPYGCPTERFRRSGWMIRFALLLFYALPASSQTSKSAALPEGRGKEIVQTVCTECHGLREVTGSHLTAQQWRNIVNDMVARGASLYEEEMDIVGDYLAKNFGPEKTTETISSPATPKVNINQASAKELETGLSLSPQETEAVIRFREKNGNFDKWEDLKKVPGLDIPTIEKEKDRLSF